MVRRRFQYLSLEKFLSVEPNQTPSIMTWWNWDSESDAKCVLISQQLSLLSTFSLYHGMQTMLLQQKIAYATTSFTTGNVRYFFNLFYMINEGWRECITPSVETSNRNADRIQFTCWWWWVVVVYIFMTCQFTLCWWGAYQIPPLPSHRSDSSSIKGYKVDGDVSLATLHNGLWWKRSLVSDILKFPNCLSSPPSLRSQRTRSCENKRERKLRMIRKLRMMRKPWLLLLFKNKKLSSERNHYSPSLKFNNK